MPSRSYNHIPTMAPVSHTYVPISGTPPPQVSYSVSEVTKIRNGSYDGTNTPNFHAMRKKGLLLPLQFYQRFDFEEDRPSGDYGGTFSKTTTPASRYTYTVNSRREVVGASSTLELVGDAVTEMSRGLNLEALLQKAVADCTPDLDALTFIAEAHKTVRMILTARKRFIKLFTEFKSGTKHLTTKRRVREASRAWLEGRYGWDILRKDIESITSAINQPVRPLVVRGVAGQSFKTDSLVNHPYVGYYVSHDYNVSLQRDLSVRATAYARYLTKSLNHLANPVVTLYELEPFSFVVDWFLSVGDVLKAWQVIVTAEEVRTSISYKFDEVGEAKVSGVTSGSGAYATLPHASGFAKSKCQFRLRMPSHVPSLQPQLSVQLSSARIADAHALLATRLK